MLSIKPIGSSTQQVSYYATLGTEDYYANGAEPPGSWWGLGSKELGLLGQVDGTSLRNLLRGFSSDGKKALVQNAGEHNRRAGFDLTFSVPKSVSIAWSQADKKLRADMERAKRKALDKTLAEFAKFCGGTRRGRHGKQREDARLIGAVFKHDTARAVPGSAPDPNVHFHVVVCNAVCRGDGTTGAFDARGLFTPHMKMALGALFRLELSKKLREIGFQSHRPETQSGKTASWFELDLVPKKLIEEFSKRRHAVEKWLRERGLTGAKAAERAALNTRQAKKNFERDELFSAWKAVCKAHGFSTAQINRDEIASVIENPAAVAEDAVKEAIKRITFDRAHFSEIELLRFAAEEGQCRGAGISHITEAVQSTLAKSQEIIRLRDPNDEARFTTREMFEIEKRMLEAVERLQGKADHQVSDTVVFRQFVNYPTIGNEQERAVRHITQAHDSITCVNGLAGTGKTFMLQIANEVWREQGLEVIGTSLAAKASQVLEAEAGIESAHLARFFWELEHQKRALTSKSVVVLDEAGMVGTRQMAKLVSVVERAGAKLVLVGDDKQLQAIEAGGPFRSIAERIGYAEMREITRQRDEWARRSVAEFADGVVADALESFAKRGLLLIAEDRDAAILELGKSWAKVTKTDLQETLIFTGTRVETATVNAMCQQMRISAGELAGDTIAVGLQEFYVGDRVVFCKNNAALFVRNGSFGTVTRIEPSQNRLSVEIDNRLTVSIQTDFYDELKLAYAVTTHKGQGMTVENAFILAGGPMTDREISYVQSSRARGQTKIFTDIISGGENIEALAKLMTRSRKKDLAHDLVLEAV